MEGRGSAGEEGPGQAVRWARAPRLVLMTPWQSWCGRGVDTGKRPGLTTGGADGRMAPGGQGIEGGVGGVGGARDPRQSPCCEWGGGTPEPTEVPVSSGPSLERRVAPPDGGERHRFHTCELSVRTRLPWDHPRPRELPSPFLGGGREAAPHESLSGTKGNES